MEDEKDFDTVAEEVAAKDSLSIPISSKRNA
jgi:hypothetical protein